MSRHVFYSLHYDADRSRVELIRNLATLQANLEAKPNEWASITRSGAFAVKRWLDQQLRGRSCLIVLIGAETASRVWVQHEIQRARELKLGLLGVHIHNLVNAKGAKSKSGPSPFAFPSDGGVNGVPADVYDPPETHPKLVYRFIADHLPRWVEKAVAAQA
jgi:hypothetical protein